MARRTKVRRGREFFEVVVARREREGLTWEETARAAAVPLPTLMDWARRLRSRPRRDGRRGARSFVELAPREAAPIERVEIVLRSGRRLVLSSGLPPAGLLAWVEALERTC